MQRKQSSQQGMGLIEVLVALMVLAIGLLGMLNMQSKGLQFNQAGYYRSQALFLAEDIVERMRSNRDSINSYAVDYATDVEGNAVGTAPVDENGDEIVIPECAPATHDQPDGGVESVITCDASGYASSDMKIWKALLVDLLPAGDAEITVSEDTAGLYHVTVSIRYQITAHLEESGDQADADVDTSNYVLEVWI
ncbi:MAG: type IV pilus modification protein PilV [Pseudomonadales bacterium]